MLVTEFESLVVIETLLADADTRCLRIRVRGVRIRLKEGGWRLAMVRCEDLRGTMRGDGGFRLEADARAATGQNVRDHAAAN